MLGLIKAMPLMLVVAGGAYAYHTTTVSKAEATIAQLEANNDMQAEMDDYLSIFKRHDLTRLARAKPGMVEPRINNGTKKVFEQIEKDSEEVQNADIN